MNGEMGRVEAEAPNIHRVLRHAQKENLHSLPPSEQISKGLLSHGPGIVCNGLGLDAG